MRRVLSQEGQLVLWGEVDPTETDRYTAVHLLNLGPSHVVLTKLTLGSKAAVLDLPYDDVIAPGNTNAFISLEAFGKLHRNFSDAQRSQYEMIQKTHDRFLAIEATSSHGLHQLHWNLRGDLQDGFVSLTDDR